MRILAQIDTNAAGTYESKGGSASSGGNEPNKGGMYGDKLPKNGEDRKGKGGR